MNRVLLRTASLTIALSVPGRAQVPLGSLVGVVTTDSTRGEPLAGADLWISIINRSARTTWRGEYRIDDLPPGPYTIQVRSVGRMSITAPILIKPDAQTHADFVLLPAVVVLDSVVTAAPKSPRVISPALRSFEERRKSGFGYFISTDELRKNDDRKLADVLAARAPGLRVIRTRSGNAYVASGTAGKDCQFVFLSCTQPKPLEIDPIPNACYTTVYLDGVLLYDLSLNGGKTPPISINAYNVDQLAGVEFYRSGATAPNGYRDSGCGLLLLWTRER